MNARCEKAHAFTYRWGGMYRKCKRKGCDFTQWYLDDGYYQGKPCSIDMFHDLSGKAIGRPGHPGSKADASPEEIANELERLKNPVLLAIALGAKVKEERKAEPGEILGSTDNRHVGNGGYGEDEDTPEEILELFQEDDEEPNWN